MSDRSTFERPGWTRVKFGGVVRLCTERCPDPAASGIERYVGLEHIEPGNLRIRSWGNVSDGVTFTNRFKPGQVLFGKRRAYQRKVAVAHFEGVCSGDIYVFEPSDLRLIPALLPFICQSDGFYDHALKTSAGSLSPRTNWTSLADYLFTLPPLEEQQRVVQMCTSLEDLKESLRDCNAHAALCRRGLLNHAFVPFGRDPLRQEVHEIQMPAGYHLVTAKSLSIAPVTKGDTPRGEFRSDSGTVPFIKIYNLNFDGRLDFSIDPSFINERAHSHILRRSQVLPGDILMNLVGPPMGKIGLVTDEYPEWNINQAIARYRPHSPLVGRYLWYYLQSDWAQRWLLHRSKKTSGQRNLTLQLAQDLPVPMPTDDRNLSDVVDQLDQLDAAAHELLLRGAQVRELQRAVSQSYIEASV